MPARPNILSVQASPLKLDPGEFEDDQVDSGDRSGRRTGQIRRVLLHERLRKYINKIFGYSDCESIRCDVCLCVLAYARVFARVK
jgi:hypothetical protein